VKLIESVRPISPQHLLHVAIEYLKFIGLVPSAILRCEGKEMMCFLAEFDLGYFVDQRRVTRPQAVVDFQLHNAIRDRRDVANMGLVELVENLSRPHFCPNSEI